MTQPDKPNWTMKKTSTLALAGIFAAGAGPLPAEPPAIIAPVLAIASGQAFFRAIDTTP